MIRHPTSQLALLLYYRDILNKSVVYIFPLVYGLVHCNIYRQQ